MEQSSGRYEDSGDAQTPNTAWVDEKTSSLNYTKEPNTGSKGKEKAETSTVGRIWASGKAMLSAAGSNIEPLSGPSQPKVTTRPGAAEHMELHQETYTKEGSRDTTSSRPRHALKAQTDTTGAGTAFKSFMESAEPPSNPGHYQTHMLRAGPEGGAIAQQEFRDGSAVVDLLGQGEDQPRETETYDEMPLTHGELARLRTALFDTGSSWPSWDQLLNFTPSLLSSPEGGEQTQALVGTPDAETARSIWLCQWNDVLSAYTDAVWGDIAPLAVEAKREIDEMKGTGDLTGNSSQARAVERLRLILAHVRGH